MAEWPHQSSHCPECGIKQGDLVEQPCRLSLQMVGLQKRLRLEMDACNRTDQRVAELEARLAAVAAEAGHALGKRLPEVSCESLKDRCVRLASNQEVFSDSLKRIRATGGERREGT